ncbi:hypothetical protein R6138_04351 [Ralstonia thomasii]|uniref:replicative helicase loader/inhibitor n=1 Tax=Ralstonia thomasii TaxID=3058596 RepID=UPI0028F5F22B|nr:replicative helicase loader/inhibitor [Ralstonia sp. LMG 18095]CAJ0899593.1 hypothetical protein R6138_04351 [Ralstonia sp. LMG 18095]
MKDAEKAEFSQVVRAMFDNYGRQAPLPETLRLWWGMLTQFDIVAVRNACQRHIETEPKFPPTIAQLLAILRPAELSGRPGQEEAWSIAVRACDEAETVVMNDEIALAWGAAKPIFDLGDEVGARMAFKEVYERQVSAATGPAKWWPSLGTDQHKRDVALSEARRQGLLPAPQVAALLPNHTDDKGCPEGLKRLKEAMAQLKLGSEVASAKAEQERIEERQRVADQKKAIANQIATYAEQKRA